MKKQPRVSIGIPVYNGDRYLEQALNSILAQTFSDLEIIISDNGSTDKTQEVIKKWQTNLSHITFKSSRNSENIGVMRNIIHCLKSATTKYVWTIGDDDPIQDRAVPYVISKLKQHEDLSLLFLNFSGRNQITGEPVHPPTIVGNRWFDVDSEDGNGDGKAIFEHCFAKSVGAVIFLTASIYRTDLVQRGLQIWQEAENNWISLAYLAGYCAANGRVIVTKDTYVECVVGVSYWQKDPKSALLMQYKHQSEVVMKLGENGYSKQFCRRMILKNFKEANLRVFLGALRRWPVFTIQTIVPFLTLVGMSVFDAATTREFKMVETSEQPAQNLGKYPG